MIFNSNQTMVLKILELRVADYMTHDAAMAAWGTMIGVVAVTSGVGVYTIARKH